MNITKYFGNMKNNKKGEYLNKFDIEDNIYNFNNKMINCLDF